MDETTARRLKIGAAIAVGLALFVPLSSSFAELVVASFLAELSWRPFILASLGGALWLRRRLRRLRETPRAEEMLAAEDAALHRRIVDTLALALQAKDHHTVDGMRRIRICADETARELRLSPAEAEAVHVAALLLDVGMLAVPAHLRDKTGALTREEAEKLQSHPVIGAQILETVKFPYPVAPIVRSHHERWDGGGYPDGLRGEEIPLGARILAVAECFDAALWRAGEVEAASLDEALDAIETGSGTFFDPRVVASLRDSAPRLHSLARLLTEPAGELGTVLEALPFGRGRPNAAESTAAAQEEGRLEFLDSIAAARHEVQTLFDLARELGNSLSFEESLTVLSARLGELIRYDTAVVYVLEDDLLTPRFLSGIHAECFADVASPLGAGPSGAAAALNQAVMNGDPSGEVGYRGEACDCDEPLAALSAPLEGAYGLVGVLALYSRKANVFSNEDLRVLDAIRVKIALAVENALNYSRTCESAVTDYLTALPNARSLFVELAAELRRAERLNEPLAVLVGDLDGFKAINDRLGHLAGNHVLWEVAQALRRSCRSYDYVARLGGDEFVVLLGGLGAAAAAERAAIMQAAVEETGRETLPGEKLTMSVGIAAYPEDGLEAECLLDLADRRMYRRKSALGEGDRSSVAGTQ